MNAVGIDVSKGKSTVVVMRPFGEVVAEPFEVSHTDAELSELACFLGELPGETRIVMEYTGNYWQPIAKVRLLTGEHASDVRCDQTPCYPCGSSTQHNHKNYFHDST